MTGFVVQGHICQFSKISMNWLDGLYFDFNSAEIKAISDLSNLDQKSLLL